MKPADLLNELETGDRSQEQLFPEEAKHATSFPEQVNQIVDNLYSSMGDYMARHITEHQRMLEREYAERAERERQMAIRRQNVELGQLGQGIGIRPRRGFFGD